MKPELDVSLRSGIVAFAVVAVLFALPAYVIDTYRAAPVAATYAVTPQTQPDNGRVAGVSTSANSVVNSNVNPATTLNSTNLLGIAFLTIGGAVLAVAAFMLWRQPASQNYLAALLVPVTLLAFSTPVSAAGSIRPPTDRTLVELIQGVIGLLPGLILLVLLGMFIYGGYVRLSAAGDADKEEQSNKILTAAVLGFVIIALAPLLINLLGQFLGLGTLVGS